MLGKKIFEKARPPVAGIQFPGLGMVGGGYGACRTGMWLRRGGLNTGDYRHFLASGGRSTHAEQR